MTTIRFSIAWTLLAGIACLAWGQEAKPPATQPAEVKPSFVTASGRHVFLRGEAVKLSPKEYDLLRIMVQHAGKVLTHKFAMKEVWGGATDVQYLRVYVRSLRQKIEADPERPVHILTEQGVGYRLRAD